MTKRKVKDESEKAGEGESAEDRGEGKERDAARSEATTYRGSYGQAARQSQVPEATHPHGEIGERHGSERPGVAEVAPAARSEGDAGKRSSEVVGDKGPSTGQSSYGQARPQDQRLTPEQLAGLPTVVVFNPRGGFIDGCHDPGGNVSAAATQAILTSGGPNTAGTVRVSMTQSMVNGKTVTTTGAHGH